MSHMMWLDNSVSRKAIELHAKLLVLAVKIFDAASGNRAETQD